MDDAECTPEQREGETRAFYQGNKEERHVKAGHDEEHGPEGWIDGNSRGFWILRGSVDLALAGVDGLGGRARRESSFLID
jgi:hypothetical protein